MSGNDIVSRQEDRVLTETTDKPVFKPTPAMRLWIEAELKLMTDNISAIADECSLERSNWYKWIKDESFIAWYRSEWDKLLKSQGPTLDKIGLRFSKRGDYKFWEAMQRRVGNLKDDKQGTTVAVQNNVNLNKYIEE